MSGRTDAAIRLVRAAARSAGLGQRTDPELLAAFLAGERDAFEALVRRHGPLVLQGCRQAARCEADAEDAFQATFVQLHQRAASIRNRPSLAGWLFRVARRSAANARRAAQRRERREASVSVRPEHLSPDLSWHEGCAVLHEELDRLPDVCRLPLLLCYLEGLSRDEAARRLGWSLNVLRGRLERGRSRLRDRVAKRGITLSAGLLAAMTAQAVPTGLLESATAGAARPSARVAELAAAGARGRYKLASALALAAGLVLGLVLEGTPAGAEPPAKGGPKPAATAAVPDKSDTPNDENALTGRVVDPDRKPVAGARVWLVEPWRSAREVTKTAADGTFRLPPEEQNRKLAESEWVVRVVATHERLGLALPVNRPGGELVLRLAPDDVPVRGRVLDL